MVPRSTLLRGAYFNEYMRPHELHWGMILWLDCRGAIQEYLSMTRARGAGEFERGDVELAERLLPHLRRALLLDRRLLRRGLHPAGAEAVLDALRHALLLIDDHGAAIHVNRAAERLLAGRDGLAIERGQLCAATAVLTARLQGLLAQAVGRSGGVPMSGTMALPRPSGRRPLMAVAVPLRREVHWLRPQRAAACLCISDPEQQPNAPPAWLSTLFGLTVTEAAVAELLLAGDDTHEIAAHLGISYQTVRAHLARIMGKTGTRRQSELILLLSSVSSVHAEN
jgi:DNA-binding CsgD family transcriptional regulator